MAILLITPGLKLRDGITAHSLNLLGGWLQSGTSVYVANPGTFSLQGEVFLENTEELDLYLAGIKQPQEFDISEVDFEKSVIQYAISTYWLRIWSLNRWIYKHKHFPIILCCHEPTRELAILKVLGRKIYKAAASGSSKVVAFSQSGRESLESFLSIPVQVFSLGVPEVAISKGSGGELPNLLLFGYYLPDKGFELGLMAVLDALRKHPGSLHLTVVASLRERVGSSRIFARKDSRNFERYLASLRKAESELPGNIEILGYLTHSELLTQLDKTDYLLLPYKNMTNSGVAVTAKAHGLPVIASNLKSLREAFGDSAIYVDDHAITTWSSRLIQLTSDLGWRAKRDLAGEELVEMRRKESSGEISRAIISPN